MNGKFSNSRQLVQIMTSLIIDTSSDYTLLGIAEQTRLISSLIAPHHKELSTTLLPAIEQLIKKESYTLKQIHFIAVGIGPGSYTGTRMGVSVAQSLAYGLGIPLISFCSSLAFIPPSVKGSIAFVAAAKSGHFFLLKGKKKGALISELTLYEHLEKSALDALLEGVESMIGEGGLLPSSCLDLLPAFVNEKFEKKEYDSKGAVELIYLSHMRR
jgi:tRNA threonylcarbamoyladenosine biosynthesis protein TsaB